MTGFIVKGKAKEIGSKITEHFKEDLNQCIEENGRTSFIVVKESQELDRLVVREQLKKVKF